ncbi:hypothetical protein [Anaeromyxobacter oryzisoli]|jgi:hypothetical protein|uniref:hypothetical protein n=1 Tax=Anaeromyxobacter oryzisoli TaxID=2925408 RepID=UPI001F591E53|nr:hypothetical protein [Anaeromyxobacter sp. SG63]
MYARWASFGVGLGLVFAPLLLGYGAVGPILHDVAMGLLVCIGTLASFEWPPARFGLAVPAVWLAWSARTTGDRGASVVEVVSGVALLLLALFPSTRLAPPLARDAAGRADRAGARA